MTNTESISAAAGDSTGGTSTVWRRIKAALEAAGDRLNPILVKETRQALKSRQFTVTFALLLLAGWVWSLFGVAVVGPRIYYSFEGPLMFYGYFLILAFPLAVVVPFSAYRSLATEREDNTYELLSISTLKPRQIVSGKLGSAVVQMMVYFSAIAPCLAFTYLLRGVDIVTVGLMLYYAFFGSLGLSMIGLLVATLQGSKFIQVIFSVALIAGLFLVFWATVDGTPEIMREIGSAVDDWEFWVGNALLLNVFLLYFALFFLATAAQLTFASENRSTALRVVMLAMQVCLTGWMAWIWLEGGDEEVLAVYAILVGVHWYFMGALMTGEWPHLSDRVKRGLPQSFLGRAVLTWFNPGPGTGYVFAIANLAGAAVLVLVAVATAQITRAGTPRMGPSLIALVVLGASYITIYLGLGKLLVAALRRVFHVTLSGAMGIQLILLALGMGVPVTIHWSSPSMRNVGYSLLQITNPLWTLAHAGDFRGGWPPETPVLMVLVPALAGIVFAMNVPSLVREIAQVRVSMPPRILEEDAELAPKEEPVPESPWG